jgi:hypothetical protein
MIIRNASSLGVNDAPDIDVGDRRKLAGEDAPLILQIEPHRQRRAGRERGVHQLLPVLAHQQNMCSWPSVRSHRVCLDAEGVQIAFGQRVRKREDLQDCDTQTKFAFDRQRDAACDIQRIVFGLRPVRPVVEVNVAEVEAEQRQHSDEYQHSHPDAQAQQVHATCCTRRRLMRRG